jgi:putative SOS response-associated peptidase YedK
MCYDISYTIKITVLADYFPDLMLSPQLEVYAGNGVHIMGQDYGLHPIIYRQGLDGLWCRQMEWGCLPFYVKDESSFLKQRATMLNARSERILEDSKSSWFKIRDKRCAIPVNGIYEHRVIKGWKKKVPYYVKLKDQPMFFLPGLYSIVDLPDQETGEMIRRFTFTLITRHANSVMQAIHNDGENMHRMPLFLPLEMSKKWLKGNLSRDEYRDILNFEMPSKMLDYWPVYTIRGPKSRPDNKLKNEPWTWDKLPELK